MSLRREATPVFPLDSITRGSGRLFPAAAQKDSRFNSGTNDWAHGCSKSSRRQYGCGGVVTAARDEVVRQEMIALLPRLRRFALVLTRSAADADDLVQATCERAKLAKRTG